MYAFDQPRSAAIGGKGPEPAAARSDLERLYKTIEPRPALSIDDLIKMKSAAGRDKDKFGILHLEAIKEVQARQR